MEDAILGVQAPDFRLSAIGGDIQLSDYRGKKVVLYFYPRDNTAGCSNQALGFRELTNEFAALGAVILGVSRDSLGSHEKFAAKLELPFLLLSDSEGLVCELYQVLKEKNLYGKKSIGIERSTFIIDEKGIVRHSFRKVKVAGHAEAVLQSLKQL
jgi:peroxiredoxin Q/BCP